MKIRKASYEQAPEQIEGETNREQGTDAVKVALIREDLASLRMMKESVSKRIEQLHLRFPRGGADQSDRPGERQGDAPSSDSRQQASGA